MADTRVAIAMNLNNLAVTQYDNHNFNSLCVCNGIVLGASDEGLFRLDHGSTDNGSDINAFIETPTQDFGYPAPKRMRRAIMEMETSGDLKFKVTVDDRFEHTYEVRPDKKLQKQHRAIVPMGRGYGQGTYWSYRIENVGGCDFSVDALYVEPVLMSLRRG